MKKIRTFLKKLIVLMGGGIIWVVWGVLLFTAEGGDSHYLFFLVLWVLFSLVLLGLFFFWVFVAVKKWVRK